MGNPVPPTPSKPDPGALLYVWTAHMQSADQLALELGEVIAGIRKCDCDSETREGCLINRIFALVQRYHTATSLALELIELLAEGRK